jgi:hypothetical protein
MKNLKEFIKIEEHTRVVSAWKFLPYGQRKLLRLQFQIEVIRITFPGALLDILAIFVAFMFFIVTPFPRIRKRSTH